MLQNCDLLLLRFDIQQKWRWRVLCALKPMNHLDKIWKYIWKIPVKNYFANTNSCTKIIWLAKKSYLLLDSSLIFNKNADNVYRSF